MRNACIATGVVAMAALGFACELQHDGNTEVAFDFHRPMAETEWLRIGIRQFEAVVKCCTFTDTVRTGAVIPWSVCGRATVR